METLFRQFLLNGEQVLQEPPVCSYPPVCVNSNNNLVDAHFSLTMSVRLNKYGQDMFMARLVMSFAQKTRLRKKEQAPRPVSIRIAATISPGKTRELEFTSMWELIERKLDARIQEINPRKFLDMHPNTVRYYIHQTLEVFFSTWGSHIRQERSLKSRAMQAVAS